MREPSALVAPGLWTTNRTLAPHIPVLALGNYLADPCAAARATGADCALLRLTAAMGEAFMRNMTTMTAGSAFLNACAADTDPACLDWLGAGATVPFVAREVLARF